MYNSYLLETLQAAADMSLCSAVDINSVNVADVIGTGSLTDSWDVLGGWTEHVKSQSRSRFTALHLLQTNILDSLTDKQYDAVLILILNTYSHIMHKCRNFKKMFKISYLITNIYHKNDLSPTEPQIHIKTVLRTNSLQKWNIDYSVLYSVSSTGSW